MTSVPRVSVILPVFNGGTYLKCAVDSVLGQTFTDFELLVINDGSSDGSTDYLREAADPRLNFIDLPANRGVIFASNLGLSLAKAPLIAMMDADDIAEPDRLAVQVTEFEASRELALLGTCAALIDSDGRRFGTIRPPLSVREIRSSMFLQNAFVHTSVMFRTSAARALGFYSDHAKHAQDYDLFLRMALEYPCKNLDRILVGYRVHGGQDSQTSIARQRDMATKVQHEVWADGVRRGLTKGCCPPVKPTLMRQLLGQPGTLGGDHRNWASIYARMGRQPRAMLAALRGLRYAPLSLGLYVLLARSVLWWLVPTLARATQSTNTT